MKDISVYINEALNESVFDKDLFEKDPVNCNPNDKRELIRTLSDYVSLMKPKKGSTIDLNWINTSKVEDLGGLADIFKDYNIDVSKWDVSRVTNFTQAFAKMKLFNCDLSEWDVSSGKYFAGMFKQCKSFTGQGLDEWNIDPHANIYQMFQDTDKLKALPEWYQDQFGDKK